MAKIEHGFNVILGMMQTEDDVEGEEGGEENAVGAEAPGEQVVVIKVKNVPAVVAKQGAVAAAAFAAVPQMVTNQVYSGIADKLKPALLAEGVDADVTVSTAPGGGTSPQDLMVGVAIGAGLVGLLLLAKKLVTR